jgi:hypothetical protein
MLITKNEKKSNIIGMEFCLVPPLVLPLVGESMINHFADQILKQISHY